MNPTPQRVMIGEIGLLLSFIAIIIAVIILYNINIKTNEPTTRNKRRDS